MILFCDTSVLVAACGSASGASRFLFEQATSHGWRLVSSPWCIEELERNLHKLPSAAAQVWEKQIQPQLEIVPNALTLDKLLVFPKSKNRPVLLAALAARVDVLLTLDRADFQESIGSSVYGMAIKSPGEFLMGERGAGRL